MADILDEVLNDEKDEKRLLLFRKLLPTIIAATIFIAIAMTGYSWYKNRITEHNKQIGDMFTEIVSDEPSALSVKDSLEELIKKSENHQAELAQLHLVNLMISENDTKAAMAELESIIDNSHYLEVTTSYARLLWIGIILDKKELSEMMQAKARDYLEYFKKEDQLFFATATLMKALFYKKNGQEDLSAEYANSILKMKNASIIVKEQALAVLSNLEKRNKL